MEIVERIKQQLQSKPVVLFMKGTPDFPQCGFSAQTVAALRDCGAEFAHVNIFEDPDAILRWRCTAAASSRSCCRKPAQLRQAEPDHSAGVASKGGPPSIWLKSILSVASRRMATS